LDLIDASLPPPDSDEQSLVMLQSLGISVEDEPPPSYNAIEEGEFESMSKS
jgi:hypothetical protein